MSMDLVQDLAAQVPRDKRIMIKKMRCPICSEAERGVNLFNSERISKYRIDVIDTKSLRFRRYYQFFKHIHDSDSIPTPTIYFDGHVITYKGGGCEYKELYYILDELDRLSRR